jgi:ketosteroid isomerase-like protein
MTHDPDPPAALLDEQRAVDVVMDWLDARDRSDHTAAAARCDPQVTVTVPEPAARRFAGATDRDELEQLLADESDRVPFLMQFGGTCDVQVDGDRATVDLLVLATATVDDGGPHARWCTGRQRITLSRVDDDWRIASIEHRPILDVAYASGW